MGKGSRSSRSTSSSKISLKRLEAQAKLRVARLQAYHVKERANEEQQEAALRHEIEEQRACREVEIAEAECEVWDDGHSFGTVRNVCEELCISNLPNLTLLSLTKASFDSNSKNVQCEDKPIDCVTKYISSKDSFNVQSPVSVSDVKLTHKGTCSSLPGCSYRLPQTNVREVSSCISFSKRPTQKHEGSAVLSSEVCTKAQGHVGTSVSVSETPKMAQGKVRFVSSFPKTFISAQGHVGGSFHVS